MDKLRYAWLKLDAYSKNMFSDSKKFWQKIWQNKFHVHFLKGVRILVSKFCQKTAKFKGETNCTFTRITDDYFFFSKFLFTKMTSHVVFDMTKWQRLIEKCTYYMPYTRRTASLTIILFLWHNTRSFLFLLLENQSI